MDSNVNLYILKETLACEDSRSYICTSVSNSLMHDINLLKDSEKIVRITISTDELMLAGISEIIEDTP